MVSEDRASCIEKIEALRGGRTLICFFNFDRQSRPQIFELGLTTQFLPGTKEPLFRVLKESVPSKGKIDLCLYTRGGDVNSVWPIVSLLREFDPDFEVLVPFRCHSSGTLLALGAKKIILTLLSELSPIDPSTGNQFNPIDRSGNPLGIGVEDVMAYKDFIAESFKMRDVLEKDIADDEMSQQEQELLRPFLDKLVRKIHPLALGNVHRVYQLIKQLAKRLLDVHAVNGRDVNKIIDQLTARFYSHLHMINRHEALEILGKETVEHASSDLSSALDNLLRLYEKKYELRNTFSVSHYLGNELKKDFEFIGGVIESKKWSYSFKTKGRLEQFSKIPPNIQIQVPPGQPLPLFPGLPRQFNFEIEFQEWSRTQEVT